MLSHWFGLIGEAFNLAGAIVLALDVFLREKERKLKHALELVSAAARLSHIQSTEYKGVPISEEGFAEKVLHRRSVLAAYCGLGLLGVSFLFLCVHHILEIRQAQ